MAQAYIFVTENGGTASILLSQTKPCRSSASRYRASRASRFDREDRINDLTSF